MIGGPHTLAWTAVVIAVVTLGLRQCADPTAPLGSPNGPTRHAAALALGARGPAAAPAVPRLIAALDDPATVEAAAWALGEIGPAARAAIPALAALTGRGKAVTRMRIATALRKIAPDDAVAQEALERLRASPQALVRRAAGG